MYIVSAAYLAVRRSWAANGYHASDNMFARYLDASYAEDFSLNVTQDV